MYISREWSRHLVIVLLYRLFSHTHAFIEILILKIWKIQSLIFNPCLSKYKIEIFVKKNVFIRYKSIFKSIMVYLFYVSILKTRFFSLKYSRAKYLLTLFKLLKHKYLFALSLGHKICWQDPLQWDKTPSWKEMSRVWH